MDWSVMLEQRARVKKRVIVFPEGENEIIAQAAACLARDGTLRPLLLGNLAKMAAGIDHLADGRAEPILMADPQADPRLEAYAEQLSAKRSLSVRVCRRMVSQPLLFAAMLTRNGEADGMVAGIDCPTGDVILAGGMGIGLKSGISVPSSFYVLDIPGFEGSEGSCLVFADPAVNPSPTSEELADIAICTAQSIQALLGWEPRVAMLSFSTNGSSNHPDVEKIAEALRLARDKAPELKVDGEMQVDAALLTRIAAKKMGRDSAVAGHANILVFPDLDAANIASKLVQILANARSFGPVLQGFSHPLSDLSRNATVRDVMDTALLVAAQVA
jgi:phosphate acetyltransferase